MNNVKYSLNSYTEWGTLKEVVVGNCVNLTRQNIDLSFKIFFRENLKDQLIENSLLLQERLIAQRTEDLDALVKTLEDEGINVLRPNLVDEVRPFSTLNFEAHTTPCDNPRDQVLIWGHKIIETPPMLRTRYFENDLLKPIFYQYFSEGADWVCAPRPEMKDSSFDQGQSAGNGLEMMFDAAQCLRFGKDIIMNVSNRNHEQGFRWLSRELAGQAQVHKVEITDHHIDSMFMPLRPGLLLINPTQMKAKLDRLPRGLRKWDRLELPVLDQSAKGEGEVYLASSNIYTNVLPLSETKTLIFAQDLEELAPLAELLLKHKIEPIPVRLRHSRLFGGGAHCVTLDTVREDAPDSFF